jgi:hypothetical protein
MDNIANLTVQVRGSIRQKRPRAYSEMQYMCVVIPTLSSRFVIDGD